ncbi:hypothetical protein [uncultured Rubinisphaera sp.]|uniref:hypothetical protein n=1 Tax=uncultured Rubinisphaera sp. TaxID=1678686 RepID=UPI0030DDB91D
MKTFTILPAIMLCLLSGINVNALDSEETAKKSYRLVFKVDGNVEFSLISMSTFGFKAIVKKDGIDEYGIEIEGGKLVQDETEVLEVTFNSLKVFVNNDEISLSETTSLAIKVDSEYCIAAADGRKLTLIITEVTPEKS